MTKPQIFTVVFFALLLLLLSQIALMFRPFLFPVLWAVILAHMTHPAHVRLTARLGGRDALSAWCLTLGVLAIVVVPVLLMAIMLVREAVDAELAVRAWIEAGGIQRLPAQFSKVPVVGGALENLIGRYLLKPEALEALVRSSAQVVSGFFVDQLSNLLKNAFILVSDFLIILFTLWFLYKDGRRWLWFLYELVPLDDAQKQKIFARLDITIHAVVKGILLTAVAQGLLAGAAYAALGAPFAVVLTALTILLAPLPFGGTAFVWFPVVLYFLMLGSMGKALVMLAWGVGVVSTVDQILRPWLIGQNVQMPVLFLVFSILGGLALYGLIGLFVGPILMSILMTVISIYREEYQAASKPQASVHPPA
ncbi:MAG: AI-2E family transporter [Nitrospiraceae bacterium]|nr:AI-2E family transporter [Nitrospiraceae bacterium]